MASAIRPQVNDQNYYIILAFCYFFQGSCESLLSSPGEGVGEPPPPGGSLVPGVVRACFEHLQAYGLDTLGIFRVSTSKKRVRQLREEFDRGQTISLNVEHCPHDVATLLKEYFRDLPEPLLCRQLYTAFVRTQSKCLI